MKKNLVLSGLALIAFLAVPFVASAQLGDSGPTAAHNLTLTVNGSALLAIYNTTPSATGTGIAMSLTGANQAGAAISPISADSSCRLRISSLNDGATTRTITAKISPAMSSDGTQLFVKLTDPGNFQLDAANAGSCAAVQELTDGSVKTVVTGVKTCWSGTQPDNGYIINYRYQKLANATSLRTSTITVTYTISAES